MHHIKRKGCPPTAQALQKPKESKKTIKNKMMTMKKKTRAKVKKNKMKMSTRILLKNQLKKRAQIDPTKKTQEH
jgi:hypothetical protein